MVMTFAMGISTPTMDIMRLDVARSNLRSFGSKCIALKKVISICDIVGTFRRPQQLFGAQVWHPPRPPHYASDSTTSNPVWMVVSEECTLYGA